MLIELSWLKYGAKYNETTINLVFGQKAIVWSHFYSPHMYGKYKFWF